MWSAFHEWCAQCVWAETGQRSCCPAPCHAMITTHSCGVLFMSGVHIACGPRQDGDHAVQHLALL
eukprot:1161244-Pelagomonas_calceolata.AAC.23